MQTAERIGIERLRDRIAGRVVLPEDDGWDHARQAFNLLVDQRPDAVVYPSSTEDVADTIRTARELGLRIAPQSTGHAAAGTVTPGTILLRTLDMKRFVVDPEARQARIAAGVQWLDIVPHISPLGLAPLSGSTLDIGVVGYSLSGGLGWLGRKHGLQTNSVLGFTLVTAEGDVIRADANREPELFWAMRGGGGNFGIVTEMTFQLYPVRDLHAGVLFFPVERAGEVLPAWLEWTADLPDEVTSVGRLLRFPDDPDMPPHLRGGQFAVVEAAMLLDEASASDLIAPLRALGPAMDTFTRAVPLDLGEMHMDPPHPVPGVTGDQLLGSIPAAAIDDIVDIDGAGTDSPLISFELRHLGGALGRTAPHHGALGKLDGSFATFAVGSPMAPGDDERIQARVDALGAALAPYDVGRYWNFAEDLEPAERFHDEATMARLRAVKQRFDPDGLFVINHAV